MYINRRKKILILTLLLAVAIVAAGIWWLNFRNSSEQKNSDSQQDKNISACDVFSLEDAKSIFKSDVHQTSLDDNDENKLPTKLEDAPQEEANISSCAYTTSELVLNNPINLSDEAQTEQPAPEGSQKPVNLRPFANAIKRQGSDTPAMPEFLVLVTINSTSQKNANDNFEKSKPRKAKAVHGLGNRAFWNPKATGLSGKKQGSLSVLTGDKIVIVSGDNLGIENAQKIINIILGKL